MQQIILTCSFWGSCFNISHSDTRIANGRHVFHRIHSRLRNSVEDLMLFVPTKPSLWLVDSEKIFKVSTNQNDDLPIVAMFWQITIVFVEDLTNIVYTKLYILLICTFSKDFLIFSQTEARIALGSHVFRRKISK